MAADATTPTTKPAAEHHGATAEGRRPWYLLREAPSREFESRGHVDLDRVVVMTDGDIVESGPADALFADPRHPYTRDLLAAAPALRT